MKSFLFSAFALFSVISLQTLRADTSDSISLPAIYCAVNEFVGDYRWGSFVVIDPLSQSVIKKSDRITSSIQDGAITSVGAPNPNPTEKGGIPFIYAGTYDEDLKRSSLAVVNASDVEVFIAQISVGREPTDLTSVIAGGVPYIYSANSGSNSISVVNAKTFADNPNDSDKALVGTIPTGSFPIALTSIIADQVPYVYCASELGNEVAVINAKAFADNPDEPKNALEGKIILKAPLALTSALVSGVNYVYCSYKDGFALIDPSEFVANPSDPQRAVIQTIKNEEFSLALTPLVSDSGDAYIFCANGTQKVTVIHQKGNQLDNEVATFDLSSPISYLTSLKWRTSIKSNSEYYLYCASYTDKKILILKLEETPSGMSITSTTTINLDNEPVGLTTVYPVSSSTVDTTPAHNALKGSRSSVGK